MSKLTTGLGAWIFILSTTVVNSNEYEYLHQQQLYQAQNITHIANQLFGQAHSKILASKSPLNFKELYTLDQLLDEQRHNTLIEFHHGLSIAFDTNSNLEGLNIYGLTPKQRNRYGLDLSAIPQWAEVSELFWFLVSNKEFSNAKARLLQMGLTQKDLALIDTHISDNNIFKIISHDKILAYESIKFELEIINDDDILAATARKISYQVKNQEYITWFHWVKNLMSQLHPTKQQALFEFGKDNLGYQLIIGTTKSKRKSLDYAQRIINGDAIKTIKNNLNQIEQ